MKFGLPRSRARVILADDDADLRALLTFSLGRAGFEVEALKDGDVLRERLSRVFRGLDRAPDLVLSDNQMPGASGLEVLETLRTWQLRIPLVLMTAAPTPETFARARALGAVAVVKKPFALRELPVLLRRILTRRHFSIVSE